MNTYRKKDIEAIQLKKDNIKEVFEFTKGIVKEFEILNDDRIIARYKWNNRTDKKIDGVIIEGNYIVLDTIYHFGIVEPSYYIDIYDERQFELEFEITKDNTK